MSRAIHPNLATIETWLAATSLAATPPLALLYCIAQRHHDPLPHDPLAVAASPIRGRRSRVLSSSADTCTEHCASLLLIRRPMSNRRRIIMDGLIYLVGLIVVIMAVLSFFGLR
ncbi:MULTISPECIES: hypothetical protein [unclassified Bradyrhizobium]|uniref:hypothetical protein n=1 Tax=unclassified Bradyrhizobium TaxID=2631580 RepID=UPI0028E83D2D|nr:MULTISPECIES: hypothetical protein [unclassified Bradyrhizobium]